MTTAEKPQHMQALDRANEVRLARAELKRRIARGGLSAADVIDPGRPLLPEVESMPIMELLSAQRQWARSRSRKVLVRLAIGERRRLDELTSRQRGQLRQALGGAVPADEQLLAA